MLAPEPEPSPESTEAEAPAPFEDEANLSECFDDNGVSICISFGDDSVCIMEISTDEGDSQTCGCCQYDATLLSITAFDCTNVGSEWGKNGTCDRQEVDFMEGIKTGDATPTLQLEHGGMESKENLAMYNRDQGADGGEDEYLGSYEVRKRRRRMA